MQLYPHPVTQLNRCLANIEAISELWRQPDSTWVHTDNACMSKICRQSLQRQRGSTFTSLPLHFHHFHHLCGCKASHVAVTIHNLCSYNYVHQKWQKFNFTPYWTYFQLYATFKLNDCMAVGGCYALVWLTVSNLQCSPNGKAREILYEYYQSGMFLLLGAFLFTYSYCEH